MLYLIRSFGRGGKSILKVGYTDDINKRMNQYFYYSPGFELIAIREGDEMLEDMIQIYLKFLGYQYQRNGRLNEWFEDDPKIYQIFHIHQEKLERYIWVNRENILNLNTSSELSVYKYLKEKYPFEIKSDKFKIVDNKVIKLKFNKLDVKYNEFFSSNTNELKDTNNLIVSQFIQNYQFTNIFAKRMELLCEFLDNNIDLKDSILNLIDKKYFNYYDFLGTKGCKAISYKEDLILDKIRFELDKEIISKEVYSNFKLGDKLDRKEIKSRLSSIFSKLNLKKTPKASDLDNWFEIKDIMMTAANKRIHGFEIIALKK